MGNYLCENIFCQNEGANYDNIHRHKYTYVVATWDEVNQDPGALGQINMIWNCHNGNTNTTIHTFICTKKDYDDEVKDQHSDDEETNLRTGQLPSPSFLPSFLAFCCLC